MQRWWTPALLTVVLLVGLMERCDAQTLFCEESCNKCGNHTSVSICEDYCGPYCFSWGFDAQVLWIVSAVAPDGAGDFIEDALSTWEGVACQTGAHIPTFTKSNGTIGNNYWSTHDGANSFVWLFDWPFPQTLALAGTRAYPRPDANWVYPQSTMLSCDTYFNAEAFPYWGDRDTDPDCSDYADCVDVQTVALHEAGHWMLLGDLDDGECMDCAMYYNNPPYWLQRSLHDGDVYGVCRLYGGTGVGDLDEFSATPGDGRVQLEWNVIPDSGSHEFRIYASEDGAPYVLVHEEYSEWDEFEFSEWDEEVINGKPYTYIIWCDDGFASSSGPCVPSGSSPLAGYSDVSCEEVALGVRVQWTTDSEPLVQGFDVYRSEGWEWQSIDPYKYAGGYTKISEAQIPAHGSPQSYEFLDLSASHGRQYSYLVRALDGVDQERTGPACNPCWRTYPDSCSVDLVESPPSCSVFCPAGDVPEGSEPPLRLRVTLRDSCGFPIVGEDDFRVFVAASEEDAFQLCCGQDESTVYRPDVMLPVAPTDENGEALVDIWWGGGSDEQLEMTTYLSDGHQLPTVLQAQVVSPDMNGDCIVNPVDFGYFAPWYGSSAPGRWVADFNCDGAVDPVDFGFFGDHFGHECGSVRTLPMPPEFLARLETGDWSDAAIDGFSASPNTPNPFNPITHISYEVPVDGAHVSIVVFDLAGRQIKALVDGDKPAGEHQTTWDGTNEFGQEVPSGVYFYRVEAPGFSDKRKMVLVK